MFYPCTSTPVLALHTDVEHQSESPLFYISVGSTDLITEPKRTVIENNHKKLFKQCRSYVNTYPAFACSKSTIETPDQGVKYVQS